MGEPGSAATDLGALAHVVAPVADVLIAADRCAGDQRGALANRILLQHDGVRAIGHRGPREHADGVPGRRQATCRRSAGEAFVDDVEAFLARVVHTRCIDRVPVHGGRVEGREIDGRFYGLRGNAADGLVDGHALRFIDAPNEITEFLKCQVNV